MAEMQPIGSKLDAIGVTDKLEDDWLVEAAVVVLKIVEPNGDVRLSVTWSEGLGWLERRGMVEAMRDGEAVEKSEFKET